MDSIDGRVNYKPGSRYIAPPNYNLEIPLVESIHELGKLYPSIHPSIHPQIAYFSGIGKKLSTSF